MYLERKLKVSFMKVCLFFTKNERKGEFLALLIFF